MKNKYNFSKKNSNKHQPSGETTVSSNHGLQYPFDEKQTCPVNQQRALKTNKTRKADHKSGTRRIVFNRSMYEKIVRKELFLIKGDNKFEDMILRGKINEVIRMSCNELQENFYELGVNNELPKTWVDFKNYVVEFCANQSIYSFKKFIDERWSGYLKRLRDWACQKNIKEEVVLEN